MRNCLHFAAQV